MLARQFLRQKSAAASLVAPRLVSRTMASKAFVKYNWEDPLNLESLLTEDEIFVRDAANSYCQEKLLPRVLEAYRNESK
jgi:glutaryl-CoA dehydrogenase